jgi:hypothetical protein
MNCHSVHRSESKESVDILAGALKRTGYEAPAKIQRPRELRDIGGSFWVFACRDWTFSSGSFFD